MSQREGERTNSPLHFFPSLFFIKLGQCVVVTDTETERHFSVLTGPAQVALITLTTSLFLPAFSE